MENLNPFTRAAMTAVLVSNDFYWLHYQATGRDFDKSHNLAQDFYEKISEEVDYLMELALEVGAPIYNFTQAGQVIPEHEPESAPSYDYQELIASMKRIVAEYILSLKTLRAATDNDSIQSRLDDMVRDWEKELNYKLLRRTETREMNQFINTGADNAIVEMLRTREEI